MTSLHFSETFANTTQKSLSIAFIGFNATEKKLIDGALKISERRSNTLYHRLDESNAYLADVVMIDHQFKNNWFAEVSNAQWLANKAVIRVDDHENHTAHVQLKRPVQWCDIAMTFNHAINHSRAAQARVQSNLHQSHANTAVKQILIVDDSQSIRTQLESIMNKQGFKAMAAASVQEAVAAFQKTAFDCVLMDVVMPETDGYEGCKQIKKLAAEKNQDVAVIMLTSKSSAFDKLRGKFAGCDSYVTKPVTVKVLLEKIHAVV